MTEAEEGGDTITLRVRDQSGDEMFFKVFKFVYFKNKLYPNIFSGKKNYKIWKGSHNYSHES